MKKIKDCYHYCELNKKNLYLTDPYESYRLGKFTKERGMSYKDKKM